MVFKSLIILTAIVHLACGANILAVFHHIGYSHFKVFQPVMRKLAENGHRVTVASYFPDKDPHPNYKDLVFDISVFPKLNFGINEIGAKTFWSSSIDFYLLMTWGHMTCEKAFESPVMDQILDLHEKEPFDLVVLEFFNTDCMLGLTHKLNVPFIGLSSCALSPWHYDRFGLPDTPSYIPSQFGRFPQAMNFWQRLENWLVVKLTKTFYYFFEVSDDALIKARFGHDTPSIADLKLEASLILVNQHFSLNGPRPMTPNVIEIGGVHVEDDKPLPKDVAEILDNAENGVILVSMGTVLRGDTLPSHVKNAYLSVFKDRKETILWKWESEEMDGKPDNVILKKWLPQKEILCHPNTKAFMAHGGLLGLTEAIHCGVPAIVSPILGDQFLNAAAIADRGMAVILERQDINEKNLAEALEQVTTKR
jgi:glucuronosyltransferase